MDENIKNIKKDITRVNKRIQAKKELMEEYPKDKGLLLSLKSFIARKDVLYYELENEYVNLLKKEF
ncbi:MAG: hypothetical protein LBT10_00745 [Methanobrevibacter sp.]|jgi:hypothetical protein|nr:hypothetical protein [Methanobrevibacter sp.]